MPQSPDILNGMPVAEASRRFAEICKTSHDMSKNGQCTGCGECCADHVPLSQKDIVRIKKYIKAHHIKPIRHGSVLLVNPTVDLMCPFLDTTAGSNKKCIIYPVRPTVCKYYMCSSFSSQEKKQQTFMELLKNPDAMEVMACRPTSIRNTFFPDTSHIY